MSEKESLNTYRIDYLTSTFRATAGLLPVIGPAMAELASLIPGQRVDRVVEFLKVLDKRIEQLAQSQDEIKNKFAQEGFFELCEEACEQAAKTNSEDRRKYLAGIIAKGLTSEEIDIQESQHLLRLLGELNDIEVLVLRFYWNDLLNGDVEFRQKHGKVVFPPMPHFGSSQEDLDKASLHSSYQSHLTSLGLLTPEYKEEQLAHYVSDKGSYIQPKIKTSEIKIYKITPLGQLFLYNIEIVSKRHPY